jgi:hypothetical protein
VFPEVRDVRGNLVHDAHTAILMREHGIHEIYTRDTDFHRFSVLRVVYPWREPVGRPTASTSSTHVAVWPSLPWLPGPRAAPPSGRGR